MGYGDCTITTCDAGFQMSNGQCVSSDSCDNGTTYACSLSHGSGVRNCSNHAKGPCVATACDANYELVQENGQAVCKPITNGNSKK